MLEHTAQEIVESRFCRKHANADGLYGYQQGDPITPAGGGCVACIGERVAAENTVLTERIMEAVHLLEASGWLGRHDVIAALRGDWFCK